MYNEDCPGYATAFFDLQCELDALYDSQCDGYWEELAYQESLEEEFEDMGTGMFTDEELDMYGYDDDFEAQQFGYGSEAEQFGYEDYTEEFVVFIDDDIFQDSMDEQFGEEWESFTDEQWYEIDVEEFGQEQVDEWYGEDVEFTEDGMLDWQTVEMPEAEELVAMLDSTDVYILDNEAGLEIFSEEAWEPVDEYIEEFREEEFLEIIEDVELEALEELVEEIEEAFEEEVSE